MKPTNVRHIVYATHKLEHCNKSKDRDRQRKITYRRELVTVHSCSCFTISFNTNTQLPVLIESTQKEYRLKLIGFAGYHEQMKRPTGYKQDGLLETSR
jgi:serine kinase of HPr protein (carbohydrate metabolism regulator)